MGILSRFGDIISANINAILDKAEANPKMVDQYLRNMRDDLADVKKETAGVMAEEKRCKRLLDDTNKDVNKYMGLAKKALTAGNEEDAKVFLAKKNELEANKAAQQAAYDAAHANADKMRQMHNKLVDDIQKLEGRSATIKATMAVAKTQDKMNKIGAGSANAERSIGALNRLEDKAASMLDRATAEAELNSEPVDDSTRLAEKYTTGVASVDADLEALKREMGLLPEPTPVDEV